MELSKLQKKLNEEKLSFSDRKMMKEMEKKISDYIRDDNLDEMNINGTEFLDYSRKVKDKISDLIEEKGLRDPEEVREQLYSFFDLK